MLRRRGVRRRTAASALVLAATALAGCGNPLGGDPIERYCDAVEEQGPGLTRAVDERGPEGLLDSLPTLEELGELAPRDVEDDWTVLLGALHEFQDALEATGLQAGEVQGKLPEGLSEEDRATVTSAADRLLSRPVTRATAQVEQHALDVCHTPLL